VTYSILILAIVVIGLALGSAFNFAFGLLAIPIVLIFFTGFVLTSEGMARQKRIGQMRRFRQSSRAQKFDFTDEDKRTVV
jgi:uncharacterized membrane protein